MKPLTTKFICCSERNSGQVQGFVRSVRKNRARLFDYDKEYAFLAITSSEGVVRSGYGE